MTTNEDERNIKLGGRVTYADAVEVLEAYARLDEIRKRLPYADYKALLDLSEAVGAADMPGYVQEVSNVCVDCSALGRFFVYPGGNTRLDHRLHSPGCPAGAGVVNWEPATNGKCRRGS